MCFLAMMPAFLSSTILRVQSAIPAAKNFYNIHYLSVISAVSIALIMCNECIGIGKMK